MHPNAHILMHSQYPSALMIKIPSYDPSAILQSHCWLNFTQTLSSKWQGYCSLIVGWTLPKHCQASGRL